MVPSADSLMKDSVIQGQGGHMGAEQPAPSQPAWVGDGLLISLRVEAWRGEG